VGPIESLSPSARAALAEHVATMKHDLGKYVAFQTRWVAAEAPLAERKAALDADLRQTRRGPEGESDASAVWARFRPALRGESALSDGSSVDLRADIDVSALEDAMVDVATAIDDLNADRAGETEVRGVTHAAAPPADAILRLHKRLMKGN
jgi:hypothetical protein